MNCPCGMPRDYAECCGRYHAGAQHLAAPTAEALMRSRYAAYVLKLEPYLLATWHPTTRPAALDLAGDESRWLGLEIRRSVNNFQKNGRNAAGPPQGVATPLGGASEASRGLSLAAAGPPQGVATPSGGSAKRDWGSSPPAAPDEVEFVARYKLGGRAFRLHETSRFTRLDGHWFYVDGDQHEKQHGK